MSLRALWDALEGFDPRPRTRGDTPPWGPSLWASRFDPRPRTRGDMSLRALWDALEGFDPRPRTRGDVMETRHPAAAYRFDPRPRTRGDTPPWGPSLWASRFDPRPRTRGDDANLNGADRIAVSIHAPARGATQGASAIRAGVGVSIHAPARGATSSHGLRSCSDCVRQAGVKSGVVEVAIGQAAMVAISLGIASIVGGMSSAMASVCM